ncbi:MAG: hypothetical protein AAGF47_00040 [Planctomycetota bacterium]
MSVRIVLLIVSIFFALAARGQGLSVDDALAMLRQADGEGPIADRVAARVFRDDGTFAEGTYRLAFGKINGRPAVELRAQDLRLLITPEVVRGERLGEAPSRAALERQTPDVPPIDALSRLIPLGPMPQLWAESAAGRVVDPALGPIRFQGVSEAGGLTRLDGRSGVGPVTLRIETDSGRLHSLDAELRGGRVELRSTRVEPEPILPVVTAGRRTVSRVDQLVAAGPPLRLGDIMPDLALSVSGGLAVSLGEWLDTLTNDRPGEDRRAPWRVLVFASVEDPRTLDRAGRAISQLRAAAERRRSDLDPVRGFWLRFAPGLIAVGPSEAAGLMDDAAADDQLASLPDADHAGVPIAMSRSPADTTDRLPPGEIVLVAIDRDRIIGVIEPVEGEAWADRVLDGLGRPASRDRGGEP